MLKFPVEFTSVSFRKCVVIWVVIVEFDTSVTVTFNHSVSLRGANCDGGDPVELELQKTIKS